MNQATWESAAAALGEASYGGELTRLIGKVYALSAHQFLGATDSGVGMPSIATWAKVGNISLLDGIVLASACIHNLLLFKPLIQGQRAKMEKSSDTSRAKRDGLLTGMKMMAAKQKAAQELAQVATEEERQEKMKAMEQAQMFGMLNFMWTTTVVDITTTLHQVVQMVLHDQSVDKDTRKKRAEGLKEMGEIFMSLATPNESSQPEDAKKLYEEAAFAAMLETIKRKEEASYSANN